MPVNDLLVYAVCEEKKVRIIHGKTDKFNFLLKGDASGNTFFAMSGWSPKDIGLMAVNTENEMWSLKYPGKICLLAPPSGASVVGVIPAPARRITTRTRDKTVTEPLPSLVLLENDNRQVSLLNLNGFDSLFRTSTPIFQIRVDPYRGQIAVVTANGELKVYSLSHKAFLLKLVSGDTS